jgi:hypothetical protein
MRNRCVQPLSQRTPRPTEHSETDDLELLIAGMAREAAHHHQCSLAAATRQIRCLVARSRARRSVPQARRMATMIRASVASLLARPRLTPTAGGAGIGSSKRDHSKKM